MCISGILHVANGQLKMVSSNESVAGSSVGTGDGGEPELLLLEKEKSGVWTYFGFTAINGEFVMMAKKKRNELVCNIHRKKLHYVGNTINLLVHMQYTHA